MRGVPAGHGSKPLFQSRIACRGRMRRGCSPDCTQKRLVVANHRTVGPTDCGGQSTGYAARTPTPSPPSACCRPGPAARSVAGRLTKSATNAGTRRLAPRPARPPVTNHAVDAHRHRRLGRRRPGLGSGASGRVLGGRPDTRRRLDDVPEHLSRRRGAALPPTQTDPWPVLEPFARAAVVQAAAGNPDDELLLAACARMP